MKSSGEFNAEKSRSLLKNSAQYDPEKIVKYPFKPFDVRLAYLDAGIQPLFSRPSPELLEQRIGGNAFLLSRDTADKDAEGPPFYYSPLVCDYDCISGHARHFPILLRPAASATKKGGKGQSSLFNDAVTDSLTNRANLSLAARAYLAALDITNPDADAETAGLIWMHALAIGYSPAYLAENADGIRQDWPRVPLPADRDMLLASAALGRQVAALLDTEQPVPGVTTGTIRPELRPIGPLTRVDGAHFMQPEDLALTAGWGHGGKGGVTMPGKGRVVVRAMAGIPPSPLGETTCDVYLNTVAYWANVPAKVWEYTIGGYQVIKKWLSYRERPLLGRPLSPEEVREVSQMARRIAALLLLTPALDANYQAVKAATYTWNDTGS